MRTHKNMKVILAFKPLVKKGSTCQSYTTINTWNDHKIIRKANYLAGKSVPECTIPLPFSPVLAALHVRLTKGNYFFSQELHASSLFRHLKVLETQREIHPGPPLVRLEVLVPGYGGMMAASSMWVGPISSTKEEEFL